VVAVRKRTSDDRGFFVFVSCHEHRPLAPVPAKILAIGTGRTMADTEDVLSAVWEHGKHDQIHVRPYTELLVGEPEV
jgi:hypothetical protein